MTRIRILRVIGRLNVGGPAAQIDVLARGLDPERYDHRIIAGALGHGEVGHFALRGSPSAVRSLGTPGRDLRPTDDARAVAAVRREIQQFSPHILHTHTAKAGTLGRVAAMTLPAPVRPITVHTFHGHLLAGYFGPLGTATVRGVERVLARRTDRLVAVGTRVRDELIAAGVGTPAAYEVIPPAVRIPAPPEAAEARRQLGIPSGAPVVAFVGRLTAVKRPDRFAEVIACVERRIAGLVALVAGDGPEAAKLEGRSAVIRRLGWRPDVDVIMAAADVVLLTSDNEGMPVSLIEAALCGRPAVTTDVGSAAEVVLDGRTGLVVDRTVEALAGAVEKLLRDRGLAAAMGAAARDYALATFSPERLVMQHARLYADLLAASSRWEQ